VKLLFFVVKNHSVINFKEQTTKSFHLGYTTHLSNKIL